MNEFAIPREGFSNTNGSELFAAEARGKGAGCFPFEVFVNFEDFPFTVEPSERRFRLVLCKERWALASNLRWADFDVTDGDGDLDIARDISGITGPSSSSSVADPGSSAAARRVDAA